MGIPIAKRRPYVTRQRVAYAPAGAETGGAATDTIPRPAPHLRNYAVPPEDLSARYSALARSLNLSDHCGHLYASGLPRQDEYSQCRSRYGFEYYAQEHMSIHKKVCLRFRAKHVLVLICWQIFGKCIFLPTRMGQKFSEKLQKTIKKQKVPALSNESAGIFGAASRNRTGTGLTPGDFKSPASTSSAMAACTYYNRTGTVCQTVPAAKNDFTRRRTNSAKCRSFSYAVLSQFLLNTDLSSAPS